jgi:hypothetical protein
MTGYALFWYTRYQMSDMTPAHGPTDYLVQPRVMCNMLLGPVQSGMCYPAGWHLRFPHSEVWVSLKRTLGSKADLVARTISGPMV